VKDGRLSVLLVGNYANDQSYSMNKFASMMESSLASMGLEVILLRPPVFFGKICRSYSGLGKWLGYLDKYIVFPLSVWWMKMKGEINADKWVVHICDHSNAPYAYLFKRFPLVQTCHDLLAVRAALGDIPGEKIRATGRLLQKCILESLKKISKIACDSLATMGDCQRLLGSSQPDMQLIFVGMNYAYRPMDKIERSGILRTIYKGADIGEERYLVHVGSAAWYKNRCGLFKIYGELKKIMEWTPRLVLVGGDFTAQEKDLVCGIGIGENIIHLQRLSDMEMNALYSGAAALVFPSLHEGFGWPVVEAQASGCKVLASGRSSLLEAGGNSVSYIDPEDYCETAAKLKVLLGESPSESESRIKSGFENISRFSVVAMTEKYIRLYKDAILEKQGFKRCVA